MQQILSISDQLAPILQAARKSAGLSQTELAKRLDLSQSRMSAMELDPASMRLDQLLSICATLQLELVVQTKGAPETNQPNLTGQEW
jgi:HTH-type transcriptional regulator/antitoxin HipB